MAEPEAKRQKTAAASAVAPPIAASGAETPVAKAVAMVVAASAVPPPTAASGATAAQAPPSAQPDPGPAPITALLEKLTQLVSDTEDGHNELLSQWTKDTKAFVDEALLKILHGHQAKVPFKIPSTVLLIEPLAITSAASGTMLAAFREVMQHEHLTLSFSKTAQYEAAGTLWMLDAVNDPHLDSVSISQVESAMWLWSEEAFRMSSAQPRTRRFSFDVPLPAMVVDSKVAQRKYPGMDTVVFAHPVPLLAGRAVIITWYGAMATALQRVAASQTGASDRDAEERVFKLFEAALSVPIRLRLNPDKDSCQLLSLSFSENMFANAGATGMDSFWKFAEKVCRLSSFNKAISTKTSIPRLLTIVKEQYGLSFKGKTLTEQGIKAIKSLAPFLADGKCCAAFSLLEAFCPEMREPTLLMRIAQLCSARAEKTVEPLASGAAIGAAASSMAFAFDCLRVGRLTGDVKNRTSTPWPPSSGSSKKHLH